MVTYLMQSISSFGYLWLIAGVGLLLCEIGTPGLFLFSSLAVAAIATAPFAFWEISLQAQCLVFLGFSVINFFVMRRYIHKLQHTRHKSNIDALVGQRGVVTTLISPHRPGRIKVGGEEWVAVTVEEAYQKGTEVMVIAVRGNKLVVRVKIS